MVLHVVAPLPIGGRPVVTAVGAAVLVAGLALAAGGIAGVIRHRTTIVPHHPVSALVTDGAYRVSRNPMYTGLATAYLGTALLFGSWWPVLLWPAVMLAVLALAIRPEERYLGERFGLTYTDYRARVRRWV
jgi:protein-S-isoprenylcysteine O-methyltransferase Ste14